MTDAKERTLLLVRGGLAIWLIPLAISVAAASSYDIANQLLAFEWLGWLITGSIIAVKLAMGGAMFFGVGPASKEVVFAAVVLVGPFVVDYIPEEAAYWVSSVLIVCFYALVLWASSLVSSGSGPALMLVIAGYYLGYEFEGRIGVLVERGAYIVAALTLLWGTREAARVEA